MSLRLAWSVEQVLGQTPKSQTNLALKKKQKKRNNKNILKWKRY